MYKDIVVCVDEADVCENAIRAAARFANQANASLTGVYVTTTGTAVASSYVSFPYGIVSKDIIELAEEREAEQSLKTKNIFREIVDERNCRTTWLEMPFYEHPLRTMAYVDFIITNQVAYNPRQEQSSIRFINTLVLETGKPVILIPRGWNQLEIGKRVLIGWDESCEATRAVQNAMPLLKQADHVDAVTVNYKDDNVSIDVSEISRYLTQRDVTNSFHSELTDELSDTSERVLLEFPAKTSADLIVVGGYGHSRIREIILGGVTRNLSKHSNAPVLFSH